MTVRRSIDASVGGTEPRRTAARTAELHDHQPEADTLDNKTVGLLWSGTHGGDLALNRAGEMIRERFDNVTVNFYTGGNYPAPPPIVQQAARECDVVIGATAD